MAAERRIGVVELQRHIQNVENKLAIVIDNQDHVMRTLDKANGTLRDVVVEIGGAPNDVGRDHERRSIRWRLHDLETDRSAVAAATAAVAASRKLYEAANDRRFTRREKLMGLALALIVAAGPYIALAIHTG